MQKKTLFLTLLCVSVMAGSLTLALIWFTNKQAVSIPRTLKETLKETPASQTPQEMLKEIMNKNIKQEFLPSTYEITNSPTSSKYAGVAFGNDAKHYFAEWDIEKARFTTFVGYDKVSNDLIGYGILISVKEPDLVGKKLGDKFLKFLPTEEWSHQYPPEGGGKVETFSVISTTNHNKVYACIASFNFPKSVIFHAFPNEFTKSAAIIGYTVCMSSKFNEHLQRYFSNFCPAFSR